MIHVTSKNPRPALGHVELQDTQSGRVPWRVPDNHALGKLKDAAAKGLPVDVEAQVVWQVDAEVKAGRDAVEGVLELNLVHVDGDRGAGEVGQPAGVVEVQVAEDDGLDVGYGEADCGELGVL